MTNACTSRTAGLEDGAADCVRRRARRRRVPSWLGRTRDGIGASRTQQLRYRRGDAEFAHR